MRAPRPASPAYAYESPPNTDGTILLNEKLKNFITNANDTNLLRDLRDMNAIIIDFIEKRHCKINDFDWFYRKINSDVKEDIEDKFIGLFTGSTLQNHLKNITEEYYRKNSSSGSRPSCVYNY